MTNLLEHARNGRQAALAGLPYNTGEFLNRMEARSRVRSQQRRQPVTFVSTRGALKVAAPLH